MSPIIGGQRYPNFTRTSQENPNRQKTHKGRGYGKLREDLIGELEKNKSELGLEPDYRDFKKLSEQHPSSLFEFFQALKEVDGCKEEKLKDIYAISRAKKEGVTPDSVYYKEFLKAVKYTFDKDLSVQCVHCLRIYSPCSDQAKRAISQIKKEIQNKEVLISDAIESVEEIINGKDAGYPQELQANWASNRERLKNLCSQESEIISTQTQVQGGLGDLLEDLENEETYEQTDLSYSNNIKPSQLEPVEAYPSKSGECDITSAPLEELNVTAKNLEELNVTANNRDLGRQKEKALKVITTLFKEAFPDGTRISWQAAIPDLSIPASTQDKEIELNNFKFFAGLWQPEPSQTKVSVVMNGDTNLNSGKLGFNHEFLGGPLSTGTGQMEALCYMFAELLALKGVKDLDLGKAGIIKGLTAFAHVTTTTGDTRSLTIDRTFTKEEIAKNSGKFDLLQVVADPLEEGGHDTPYSFTHLYNSYKASFMLAETERIILPGLAGSGIFNNNREICAAAAMLAARDSSKKLDIYGMGPKEGQKIIKVLNNLHLLSNQDNENIPLGALPDSFRPNPYKGGG